MMRATMQLHLAKSLVSQANSSKALSMASVLNYKKEDRQSIADATDEILQRKIEQTTGPMKNAPGKIDDPDKKAKIEDPGDNQKVTVADNASFFPWGDKHHDPDNKPKKAAEKPKPKSN